MRWVILAARPLLGGIAAVGAVVAAAALPFPLPAAAPGSAQSAPPGLTIVREPAAGITLFRLTAPSLLDPPAPLHVMLLRLQPGAGTLRAALANDEVVGTETVADVAGRHRAVAAINAGFFLPNGDPAGLFKMDGRLISDTRRPRGAVAVIRSAAGTRLLFDRVTGSVSLAIQRQSGRSTRVAIDGIDTTRLRGRLMIFTPAYHAHTDTAAGGLEWTLTGRPPAIGAGPLDGGRTPIPADGFVLSYGGRSPPSALRTLRPGVRVDVIQRLTPVDGDAGEWSRANDIVGGAGLLARRGRYIDDWTTEVLNVGFAETRHPRTMIGVASDNAVWLVAVDGRQPAHSAGMTLRELQTLARRLGLTDALNLDGGGSTTMWVDGEVVNRPSDAAGPRKVSDVLLVFSGAEHQH